MTELDLFQIFLMKLSLISAFNYFSDLSFFIVLGPEQPEPEETEEAPKGVNTQVRVIRGARILARWRAILPGG